MLGKFNKNSRIEVARVQVRPSSTVVFRIWHQKVKALQDRSAIGCVVRKVVDLQEISKGSYKVNLKGSERIVIP